ncbi:MAG: MFS transporter [Phenylobacterium sp.]|uniref:MFS transporter n=1 Tax=Phenylobacterium sp. TaxID=1871053 RepID=UPI001B6F34DA|nr:MFS transporter [Phenylobacterium sp.]MBP7650720.1 MFS transporter [Phenylobacterium sp.]MBP7817143.1 MFS transporter [Phenylobacterium sp.]MBP9756354.1 MFS transporter [Phenylobacterium sp.]
MTVTESGGELPSEAMAPGLTPMQRARAILGGSAGNFVEWYDWFVYSSFALYFAKHFFPKGDETAQLLQAAAVFAVGFLARPIGAWFMGLYADRAGRKAALTVSVSMMCAGSFAIAIIPDYAMIGTAAPVALVLARLVQGLSLGGEYGASATYMSEMSGRKRRGFWSSFLFVTLILGQLTALGVLILLQNVLSPEDLAQWGWRIPFAIGGVLAIVVFWIRTGLEESQSYLTAQAEGAERSRTMLLFAKFPKETATIFALTSAGSLAFYAYTTYMQKFLVNTSGFTKDMATAITAAALLVYMFAQPAFGALSDLVGRKTTLVAAFLLGTIFTYPIFSKIAVTTDATMAFALMCALVLILSGYTAVNAVLKAELFPAHVRALGVALPYATANAIFGGTAEYIALWFKKEGMESGFYVYVAAIMAVAFLVALTLRDTNKHSLITED